MEIPSLKNSCLIPLKNWRVASTSLLPTALRILNPVNSCLLSTLFKKGAIPSLPVYAAKNSLKNVVEVQLLDGRTIKCTPDHKFRVYNNKDERYEWLMAKDMAHDYSMVMGFAGIADDVREDEDWSIVKQYYGDGDRERYLAIARLCGFTLGDGNAINEYGTTFKVDTLYDTQLIACDLDLLDASKDYTITDNSINFTIDVGTPVTNILNVFFKLGGSGGGVPPVLFEDTCPKAFIREFLAAYTGNDGIAHTSLYYFLFLQDLLDR